MATKEGEYLLDSEETTLSSSELDHVLSSGGLDDPVSEAEERSLEHYGVWVKVKPHDLDTGDDGADVFGLSDLEAGEDSGLTAEEEALLGELEDEPLDGGEFDSLEADLEELGRNLDPADSGLDELTEPAGEDSGTEDLDLDLEGVTLADVTGSEEDLESLSDLDLDESIPDSESLDQTPAEQEIEVSLSEGAAVDDHFTGLGEAVGPSKGSADILEMIEADLQQIKAEIQTLKRELTAVGRGPAAGHPEVHPVPQGPPGFFNQQEDETIALTGDELDNILNTADITEETVEAEAHELEEQLPELGEETMSLDLEDITAPEPGAAAFGAQMPSSSIELVADEGEELLELGSLDIEDSELADTIDTIDAIDTIDTVGEIQIDTGELESSLTESVGELELDADTAELELESLEEGQEVVDLDLESVTLEAPEDLAEELTLDEEAAEAPGFEDLELEELELDEVDSGGEPLELPEEQAELSADELLEEPLAELSLPEADQEGQGFDDLEELGILESEEEPEALEAAFEPDTLEPAADQAVGLGEDAVETAEDLLDLEELSDLDEGAAQEEPAALDELEDFGEGEGEPLELLAEELDSVDELLEVDELDSAEGLPPSPASVGKAGPPAGAAAAGATATLSPELKKDLTNVLSYLDQLLEALPEEKIQEFAQSEYFGTYQRLFDELGLGA